MEEDGVRLGLMALSLSFCVGSEAYNEQALLMILGEVLCSVFGQ